MFLDIIECLFRNTNQKTGYTGFIASTGFSLEAAREGISPAMNPMTLEMSSPVTMFPGVSRMVNSVA